MNTATSSSLPAGVKRCLERYQDLLGQFHPPIVEAFYVHGSIALGAYVEGQSDVDFIAILSRPADEAALRVLQQVHHTLAAEFPACPLEGNYLQWPDLGRPAREIGEFPCYYDGHFHVAARHDINPVTWWMLKHRAVVVFGPDPATLRFDADWSAVRAYMLVNLNTYWAAFTRRPGRVAYLLTDAGVQWAVLGICRLFYGLREGAMISKRQAGNYALEHLPERWHMLIQEALDLRAGIKMRHYRSRLARAVACMAFIKYIIRACQANAASSSPVPC
jgi:hypothetical protein